MGCHIYAVVRYSVGHRVPNVPNYIQQAKRALVEEVAAGKSPEERQRVYESITVETEASGEPLEVSTFEESDVEGEERLEFDKTLVLSASHMTDKDNTQLHIQEAGSYVDPVKGFHKVDRTILFASYDVGWFVWVDNDLCDNGSDAFSDAFIGVLRFAKDRGCNWVRFDRDGPVTEQLDKFDW